MQIQPIINQPNFNGEVHFIKGSNGRSASILKDIDTQLKNIATLLQEKKYDVFIYQNKQNKDFFNVAANTSIKQAKQIKEYTVKVRSDIIHEALVDAAKDAMDMYEKYIAKGIKG